MPTFTRLNSPQQPERSLRIEKNGRGPFHLIRQKWNPLNYKLASNEEQAMAALEGWAYPTDYLFLEHVPGGADHAYVVSSDGKRWGCGGGSQGGSRIARGHGSHRKANCFSQNTSGIVYGVNGVCHQIANRILWAARGIHTVHRAKGYVWSASIYGSYGSDGPGWAARKLACQINNWPRPRWPPWFSAAPNEVDLPASVIDEFASNDDDAGEEVFDENDVAYQSKLRSLHDDPELSKRALAGAELELLLNYRSDHGLTSAQIVDLQNLQVDLREAHQHLVTGLHSGQLSREKFVLQLTSAMREAFQQFEKRLGEELYLKVFDLPPDHAPAIINPSAVEE